MKGLRLALLATVLLCTSPGLHAASLSYKSLDASIAYAIPTATAQPRVVVIGDKLVEDGTIQENGWVSQLKGAYQHSVELFSLGSNLANTEAADDALAGLLSTPKGMEAFGKTVLVILAFGSNEVRAASNNVSEPWVSPTTFELHLGSIVNQLQSRGVGELLLVQPPPVASFKQALPYAQAVADVARQFEVPFVDTLAAIAATPSWKTQAFKNDAQLTELGHNTIFGRTAAEIKRQLPSVSPQAMLQHAAKEDSLAATSATTGAEAGAPEATTAAAESAQISVASKQHHAAAPLTKRGGRARPMSLDSDISPEVRGVDTASVGVASLEQHPQEADINVDSAEDEQAELTDLSLRDGLMRGGHQGPSRAHTTVPVEYHDQDAGLPHMQDLMYSNIGRAELEGYAPEQQPRRQQQQQQRRRASIQRAAEASSPPAAAHNKWDFVTNVLLDQLDSMPPAAPDSKDSLALKAAAAAAPSWHSQVPEPQPGQAPAWFTKVPEPSAAPKAAATMSAHHAARPARLQAAPAAPAGEQHAWASGVPEPAAAAPAWLTSVPEPSKAALMVLPEPHLPPALANPSTAAAQQQQQQQQQQQPAAAAPWYAQVPEPASAAPAWMARVPEPSLAKRAAITQSKEPVPAAEPQLVAKPLVPATPAPAPAAAAAKPAVPVQQQKPAQATPKQPAAAVAQPAPAKASSTWASQVPEPAATVAPLFSKVPEPNAAAAMATKPAAAAAAPKQAAPKSTAAAVAPKQAEPAPAATAPKQAAPAAAAPKQAAPAAAPKQAEQKPAPAKAADGELQMAPTPVLVATPAQQSPSAQPSSGSTWASQVPEPSNSAPAWFNNVPEPQKAPAAGPADSATVPLELPPALKQWQAKVMMPPPAKPAQKPLSLRPPARKASDKSDAVDAKKGRTNYFAKFKPSWWSQAFGEGKDKEEEAPEAEATATFTHNLPVPVQDKLQDKQDRPQAQRDHAMPTAEPVSRKAKMYPVFAEQQQQHAAADSSSTEGPAPTQGTFGSIPAPEVKQQPAQPVANKPAVLVTPQQPKGDVPSSTPAAQPAPGSTSGTFSTVPSTGAQAPAPTPQGTFAPTLTAPARPTVAPTPSAAKHDPAKQTAEAQKPAAPAHSTFGDSSKTLHMPQAAGKKDREVVKEPQAPHAAEADVVLVQQQAVKDEVPAEGQAELQGAKDKEEKHPEGKSYGKYKYQGAMKHGKEGYGSEYSEHDEPSGDYYSKEGPYGKGGEGYDEDKQQKKQEQKEEKEHKKEQKKREHKEHKEHQKQHDYDESEERYLKKGRNYNPQPPKPRKDHHSAKRDHPNRPHKGHHSKGGRYTKAPQHYPEEQHPYHGDGPSGQHYYPYPEDRPYDAYMMGNMEEHEPQQQYEQREEYMLAQVQESNPSDPAERSASDADVRREGPEPHPEEERDKAAAADPRPLDIDSAVGGAEEDASKPMIVTLGDYVMRQGSFGTGVVARDDAPGWISRLAAAYGDKAQVVNKGQATATSEAGVKMVQDLLADYPDAASRVKLVVLSFGGNDAIIRAGDNVPKVPIAQYKDNLKAMVTTLREAGITNVLLVTPPPAARRLDRRFKTIKDYAKAASETAKAINVPAVDLFAAVSTLQNWQAAAMKEDGLRLSERGQQLLFKRVMKALGSKLQSVSPAKLKPVSS